MVITMIGQHGAASEHFHDQIFGTALSCWRHLHHAGQITAAKCDVVDIPLYMRTIDDCTEIIAQELSDMCEVLEAFTDSADYPSKTQFKQNGDAQKLAKADAQLLLAILGPIFRRAISSRSPERQEVTMTAFTAELEAAFTASRFQASSPFLVLALRRK
ncbi:hypothetical protein WJX84_008661 [Apatococcus fuscideae]|uniref:Uncharacterized protein n=1 Tax=Apatococcus fuscideae TaxID=2026836 RepID=A0AAW1TFH7_9CHLO